MLNNNNKTETCGPERSEYYLKIFTAFLSILFIAGCTHGTTPQQHRAPLAAYEINYTSATRTMSVKSVDVSPPSSGQDISGKAGLFQTGNTEFDGMDITAPVYITNNDKDDWTGVEMQAYTVVSGRANVCDPDLGAGWYTENPSNGVWAWLFTSGTSGSRFTIPSGGQSVNKVIGFNATSNFVSVVYIYAGAPVISSITPAMAVTGETITISGYNFSTTQGSVTFDGNPATVQSWSDKEIEVTVPANSESSDVTVHTGDQDTPDSNPYPFCERDSVSIDCSTPGPNPVYAGSSMTCTITAKNGTPFINKAVDTCGGTISASGPCGTGWAYNFTPSMGMSGTCTAAVINGDATAQATVQINAVSPWPKFRANMRNTGLSTVDTSGVTGLLKWSNTNVNISIVDSPVVGADGTIYIGGSNLYAINPDGTLKWINNTPWGISYTTPYIAADGTIYVGTATDNLYAINPDGTIKWSYTTGGRLEYSSPVQGPDGTIYIGSMDDNLYAINPDGTLKWTYGTGGWIWSTPAIGADGTIYVGSEDNKLYAINPDGTLKWSYMVSGNIAYVSPAVGSDGTIYIGSSNSVSDISNLYAINPDGTLKWKYTTGSSEISSPGIGADGTIYIGSGNLYAINPDGTLKWSYNAGVTSSSPAIGADGTIYIGSACYVLAINPDGTLKWSYYDGNAVSCGGIGSSPAIGPDGSLYIGEGGGPLYAFH